MILAGLRHLRAIRVLDVRRKATHVDLSIPPGLPVEQIDVTAEHFDPQWLAAARLGGRAGKYCWSRRVAYRDLWRRTAGNAAPHGPRPR
ncbi:hypothetical protein AB0M46_40635 [Dactylosporangium sp. NPDC051485]|uniref:hypothetical protein n=1 Tax=Dactylosporangium sp. NPDC051485 TaxID=3154846 RepID=UPI003448A95F